MSRAARSGAEGPFAIAQVVPYPWETPREVNEYVDHLSQELADRGHRVLIVAPSGSRALVRESRRLVRSAASNPGLLFSAGKVRVLAMGQSLPARPRRSVSLPIDVARTIERLLAAVPLDFVHVHEPFAPSVPAAALRHSRSLNIGTFHSPTERVLSTQVARRLIELVFGRLDARSATFNVTRSVISRFFPGSYETIQPGVDLGEYKPAQSTDGRVEMAFVATEERAALRLFLRALRRVPPELPWHATIWMARTGDVPPRLHRSLRERVRFSGPEVEPLGKVLGRAAVACLASAGAAPAAQLLLKTVASGAVPVVSRIPVYEEVLRDGEDGLLFERGDALLLSQQLTRLIEDDRLRESLHRRCLARRDRLDWSHVADGIEGIYRSVAARRHSPPDEQAVRRRLSGRKFIFCDLHMHTDYSPDCATPVDVLLETAKRRSLGAIAITDHNEIAGAVEARELADGIEVIVGEEVKTAHEGEVIGLFLEKKVPRGMSLQETIEAIHTQGGLAYVPHPFDRLHAVPDYEYLLRVVDDIDILEVFNARVAVPQFNEEAVRFAAKYRVVAGAGSDSHVPQGLGTVKIRMRDFDGAREFLESLREADILRKKKSLIYLQSLKLLKARARPRAPRGSKPGRAD